MVKRVKNILWVDWGSKYVWMAYLTEWSQVVMPIWYILNDDWMLYNFGDIVGRYNIKKIVVWYPSKQEDIQQKIDKFIKEITFIVDSDISIEKMEEDYTSVEASAMTGEYKKTQKEDTLAAMKILERWEIKSRE